jgi:DNA invertase Pin-like site-specific DNA recombinase
MDLDFLAQADSVTLKLELAKQAIEAAKIEFEICKKAYDELFAKAEERGMPKGKLKKLTEERIQALFDSGMVSRPSPAGATPIRKTAKGKAKKSAVDVETDASGENLDFIDQANAPSSEVDA